MRSSSRLLCRSSWLPSRCAHQPRIPSLSPSQLAPPPRRSPTSGSVPSAPVSSALFRPETESEPVSLCVCTSVNCISAALCLCLELCRGRGVTAVTLPCSLPRPTTLLGQFTRRAVCIRRPRCAHAPEGLAGPPQASRGRPRTRGCAVSRPLR